MTGSVDNSVEIVHNSEKQASAPGRALGIFAKEPRPGAVKTRLCPPLKPRQAAALYRESLAETVAAMTAGNWRTTIFYAGDPGYFRRSFPDLTLVPQVGRDLGARMDAALSHLLEQNRAGVLIGTDSPDLPPHLVEEAFTNLEQADLVLGPARDGGYVLIGESRHHPRLFCDMPWSTSEVLPTTRRRAHESGIRTIELPIWEDLDDLAALGRLLQRSPSSRTAAFIQRHLAAYL